MTTIHSLARDAARSEHLRRIRTRRAPHRNAWAQSEIEIVKNLFPNEKALRRALPHRTWIAIRSRAGLLGLRRKQLRWLACDLSRLRRMWTADASKQELCSALARYDWEQIRSQARGRKFRRPKKDLVSSGHPIIDQIRVRARYLNLSMSDVDAMAGSNTYFYAARWLRATRPNLKHVGKAILALDGEVTAVWH
jgi:hypothetical protein